MYTGKLKITCICISVVLILVIFLSFALFLLTSNINDGYYTFSVSRCEASLVLFVVSGPSNEGDIITFTGHNSRSILPRLRAGIIHTNGNPERFYRMILTPSRYRMQVAYDETWLSSFASFTNPATRVHFGNVRVPREPGPGAATPPPPPMSTAWIGDGDTMDVISPIPPVDRDVILSALGVYERLLALALALRIYAALFLVFSSLGYFAYLNPEAVFKWIGKLLGIAGGEYNLRRMQKFGMLVVSLAALSIFLLLL